MKRKQLIIKKLSEIGQHIDFYVVNRRLVKGEKCELCNKNRKYEITTPDGEKHLIDCNCNKYYREYYYTKNTGKKAGIIGFYKNVEISENPIILYKDSKHTQYLNDAILTLEDSLVYKDGEDIKEYLERAENHFNQRKLDYGIYLTEEHAQLAIDYLNNVQPVENSD